MFQTFVNLEPPRGALGLGARGLMPDLLSQIARDRSEAAFRELYAEFAPRVRDYMSRKGADAAMSEDLAQETLLTVWRKASLYSVEKGTPAAWIFTIARNLRIDRLRRQMPWQELCAEDAATIPSEDVQPDEIASQNQRQERVRAVLAMLPAEQREIVTLAFIDGLSHGELASRLALPLGTVKSRMRLAYKKVRETLEDLK